MPKHVTQNKRSKHSLVGKEIWSVYVILKKKIFIKKFYERRSLKPVLQVLFNFPRVLCKKESEEVCDLIKINFDSFANIYSL